MSTAWTFNVYKVDINVSTFGNKKEATLRCLIDGPLSIRPKIGKNDVHDFFEFRDFGGHFGT
eukprot:m.1137922 g.1137922  ORF g.1137922 m.1137922 type:complete len:62 (+) comp24437_c1_seq8:165-350(+)